MSEETSVAVGPWDLVAEGYAATGETVLGPFAAHALEHVGLGPESEIVDVAAGTGLLSLAAAAKGAKVDAIDLSAPMIEQLTTAAELAGHTAITAQVGDGQELPYADASFDAGFSLFGLMFFPDRPRGFAELRRVLRPGATAVVTAWAPAVDSSLMRALFGALTAGDPNTSLPRPNARELENPAVFEAEMRAAGFDDVTIRPHTVEVYFPDAQALWDTMTRSSAPLTVLRHEVGEEEWQRRTEAAIEHLTVTYRPNTALFANALIGVGTVPAA
ncbi:methyltransferase domain-containing protein [Nocardia sp. AG03]|uniref:class I SAM-dependent methyltransferase n=1 Tax=Nocardia sp. AG03 TaxID=3025312 RepID=UPI002418AAB2|nr:methyltransferase domain-containing protein [Nocardia sp. AG03]